MAVEYKGGKCERCGYSQRIGALEFHHLDSSKKDFNISQRGYTRGWKQVVEELEKCAMLCANCHRELHAQVSSAPREIRSGKASKFRGTPKIGAILSQAHKWEGAETRHSLPKSLVIAKRPEGPTKQSYKSRDTAKV